MKIVKSVLLFSALMSALVSNASELEERAIQDILSVFGPGSDSGWEFVAQTPEHILQIAVSEQLEVEEMLRQQAPATLATVLEREGSAQFHSIYGFFNTNSNLYRVVWYYQWQTDCGTSIFELNFSTYSETGGLPNIEVPLSGASGTEADCAFFGA